MRLADMPPEILLHTCKFVAELHDRAALCLAEPRLGLEAQRRLQRTLRMLNERIKLALPETLAPSDGGGPAAVALEDDVHGGARLWRRPLGAGHLCPTLLGALPGALLWSQLDDALL